MVSASSPVVNDTTVSPTTTSASITPTRQQQQRGVPTKGGGLGNDGGFHDSDLDVLLAGDTNDGAATDGEARNPGDHRLVAGVLAAALSLCVVIAAGAALSKTRQSRHAAATVTPMLLPLRRGDIGAVTPASDRPRPCGNSRGVCLFGPPKLAPAAASAALADRGAVATAYPRGTRAGLTVYSIAASSVAWRRALETGQMGACEIMLTAETAPPEPMSILPQMRPLPPRPPCRQQRW